MKPGFTLEAAKTSNTTTIADYDGYTLKFSKTYITATRQWHVTLARQVDNDVYKFECFLTDGELQSLKDSI